MKYLGIVDALEADLKAGVVRAGDRLPPQRAIAQALGVDLTTVTRAFNEARRRGLVDAQAGRGTFVRAVPSALSPLVPFPADFPRPLSPAVGEVAGSALDLSMNIPPQPEAARLAERIPAAIAEILAAPGGLHRLHYQESGGNDPDRAAGAAWLARRVPGLTARRVVVAAGAQAALFAVCQLLLRPGDVVAAGAHTYPGLKAVTAALGLGIAPLAMDHEGVLPHALEAACRGEGPLPRALYVIPAIDNPTTATLPPARRAELIAVARRHGLAIIEDDPYSALMVDPPAPLAALAADITWHIATVSKCATPALRVAYVAAPGPAQALRLAATLRACTLMAPPLMAALASRWIADGTLEGVAAAIGRENTARQALAARLLAPVVAAGGHIAANPRGHHIWLTLPPDMQAGSFAVQADRSGIAIVAADAFACPGEAGRDRAVRLSLGVAPDLSALEDALCLLADLAAQPALVAHGVV